MYVCMRAYVCDECVCMCILWFYVCACAMCVCAMHVYAMHVCAIIFLGVITWEHAARVFEVAARTCTCVLCTPCAYW